jgi:hypothetical protein
VSQRPYQYLSVTELFGATYNDSEAFGVSMKNSHGMKQIIAYFSLFILQTGCRDNAVQGTKLLDLKAFRIEAPETWKAIADQGYDSQVGRLTNGSDVLTYEYGWYSYTLRNETSATHLRTVTTIDGRSALIVRPKKTGQGLIGLHVEVDGQNRLSLTGRDIRDESTVIRMFESVRF